MATFFIISVCVLTFTAILLALEVFRPDEDLGGWFGWMAREENQMSEPVCATVIISWLISNVATIVSAVCLLKIHEII